MPDGIPQWTLGDRLRKARTAAGLDRQHLADDFGVSARTVSNYENDQTRAPKLVIREYALRCRVPVEWLETGLVGSGDDGGDGPRVVTGRHTGRYGHSNPDTRVLELVAA